MRYAMTADGVRIAYGTAGQGRPLVRLPSPPFVHVQIQWRQSVFYDRLCENRLVITFDPRGSGMSDRKPRVDSFDARLLDLDAVVEDLGLETFALNGTWFGGTMAVRYAARHPERVTHLVLDDAPVNCATALQSPQVRAFNELSGDWVEQTEMMAFSFAGVGGDEARSYAEFMRASTTQDNFFSMVAAFRGVDVTNDLPLIQAPTLILRHSGFSGFEADAPRKLATLIPNARLVMLSGKETDDLDETLREMAEFLGDEGVANRIPQPGESSLRTILFTDLVGHTEMMRRLGDDRGRDVLREHERITRDLLKEHGGVEVKTMGDGFVASFASITKAMDCAIGLQRAFALHRGEPLQVRVGLNAGEPIEEDGDLFGLTVIMASRIAAKAGPGEILIPEPLRHLLTGKSYVYADRGETMLKGFKDAVRLYEVRWQE